MTDLLLPLSIPSPSQGVWYLGPFPVRAYALCIILGVVVAVWMGERRWVARGGQKGQIADIEDRMARAQVIDVSKLSGTQVKFGATVSVVDEDTEEEASYQIVGEHEADVKRGRVSITSPIARAIIGKETGDVVEVNTPGGVKAYEITKVEWV